MKITCTSCHTIMHLEAAMEEAAGREFTAFLADRGPLARPLMAYLGLFRPASRALSYERALRLAREVVGLSSDNVQLAAALSETVESLRAKREQGQAKPLKNHNYLKRVLESTPSSALSGAPSLSRSGPEGGDEPTSKRAAALSVLSEWAGEDWLRRAISAGLQALVAQSLKGAPGVDTIARTADIWYVAMTRACTIEEVDTPRIRAGFERLFACVKEWPAPRDLLDLMPARPARVSLPAPEPTEADKRKGREVLRQLTEKFSIS